MSQLDEHANDGRGDLGSAKPETTLTPETQKILEGKTPTATPLEIKSVLDDVTIRQMSWKEGVCRNIAVAIMDAFYFHNILWSDDIELGFVKLEDRNCIGATWRRLVKIGLLEYTTNMPRRSKVKSRRGGMARQYRITNEKLVIEFLKRNGVTRFRRGQPELPLA